MTTGLNWLKELDIKALHNVRKIKHIKNASKLKKQELLKKIELTYLENSSKLIQSIAKSYLLKKKEAICPFTLEIPETPYFYADTKKTYYNLRPLVEYFSTPNSKNNGDCICPVTRKPFTKDELLNINTMAKNYKIVIKKKPPESPTKIQSTMLRATLDQIVGDITNILASFPGDMHSYRTLTTRINRQIIPVFMEHYNRLKEVDAPEARELLEATKNTIRQEYDSELREHVIYFINVLASR
tara:strand:- start:554 stop:1279 length:726 start_codon:yes stop_codon:yes gene_type:complete